MVRGSRLPISTRLLEETIRNATASAGIARRSSASEYPGISSFPRRAAHDLFIKAAYPRSETALPERKRHALHDPDGGVSGSAASLHGRGRHRCGHTHRGTFSFRQSCFRSWVSCFDKE